MRSRSANNNDGDDDDSSLDGYEPSPYAISILPKVSLSKSRPKRVQTLDVPPTPLKNDEDGDSDDIDRVGNENDLSANDPQDDCVASAERADCLSPKLIHCEDEIAGPSNSSQRSGRTKNRRERRNNIPSTKIAAAHSIKSRAASSSKLIQVIDTTECHSTSHNPQTSSGSDPTISIIRQCSTCHKNKGRYSCPKCNAPYCSVACYRQHDENNSCTESFYKHRVLDSLPSNKNNENAKGGLGGILARIHSDVNQNLDGLEDRDERISNLMMKGDHDRNDIINDFRGDVINGTLDYESAIMRLDKNIDNNNDSNAIMSDEDLAELASYVLQMNDGGEDDGEHNKQVLDSIPPHLLFAFECAMASANGADGAAESEIDKGEKGAQAPFVANDALGSAENAPKDHPPIAAQKKDTPNNQNIRGQSASLWWLPGKEDHATTIASMAPTLDERILALSPLPKLQSNSATQNLAYNILDVLYATSYVIRIKCNFYSHHPLILDEAVLLLSQSQVLSNDARYGSVREALQACAERLVENGKLLPSSASRLVSPLSNDGNQTNEIKWDTLAMDVATLAYHRRYVLRMLFDTLDICRSSVKDVQRQLKSSKAKRYTDSNAVSDREASKHPLERTKRQYKLAIKKIEYFLSWTSANWSVEMGQMLSEEVRAFVDDWQLPSENNARGAKELVVEDLIRGIQSSDLGEDDDERSNLLLGNGILNIGDRRDNGLSPMIVEEQMVSISTIRKSD